MYIISWFHGYDTKRTGKNRQFEKHIRKSYNSRTKQQQGKNHNNPIKKLARDLNGHFSKEGIDIAYRYRKICSTLLVISSVQFNSVVQSCLTLCNPMNCSTPDLPVHHQLPDSTQTHAHRVGDAIQGNVNQNHERYHLTPLKWLYLKKKI